MALPSPAGALSSSQHFVSTTPMHQRRNNNNSSSGHGSSSSSHQSNGMYNSNNNGGGASRRYNDIEGGGGGVGGRGGGGGMSGTRSSHDTNSNILEQQNNERISMLSDQVARLKGLTIDIGNEVREQNSLLDGMGDSFQSTRDMLSGSLRRISTMLESAGCSHMCYMVAFCVFVLVFLWWLMSHKGRSGA